MVLKEELRAVVLNLGWVGGDGKHSRAAPGDIWQHLETFWLSQLGKGGNTGI